MISAISMHELFCNMFITTHQLLGQTDNFSVIYQSHISNFTLSDNTASCVFSANHYLLSSGCVNSLSGNYAKSIAMLNMLTAWLLADTSWSVMALELRVC